MKCPQCSREASAGSIICPYCLIPLESDTKANANKKTGSPSDSTGKKSSGLLKGILTAAAVLAALVIIAALVLFMTGCAASPAGNDTAADIPALAGMEWFENGDFAILDSDPTLYAGSPIVGTWVLRGDFEDGYHDSDNIAEYTSDGYVYEWYGDGLGYYNPLCSFDYYGESLIYHYFAELGTPDDYDAVFTCTIDGTLMTTVDAQGIASEFLRISPEINLSVEQVRELYQQN